MKRDEMVDRLRQIEKLVAECLRAVDESPAAAPETPARNNKGKHSTGHFTPELGVPIKPFVKKHAGKMSGPQRLTLLVGHMAKGKVSSIVELAAIQKAWGKMTLLLGKFNPAYANRAKYNGWIDSPKPGSYVLLAGWTEIFSGKNWKAFNALLYPAFDKKHSDSAVKHFQNMVDEYRKGQWDDTAAKGGKFIEAVMKALWVHVGEVVPKGKLYKAGTIIDQIKNKAAHPERIRLTIPRACQFAYEIASNRGARHDADEIDANEMDATVVMGVCSWILAEMVSFAQKGLDLAEAKAIVEGLMRRRFPFTEDIEGRIYSEVGKSAPEVALIVLFHIFPKRMSEEDLARTIKRHQYSEVNAAMAVTRLGRFTDDDGNGNLRLRNPGVRRAEN